MKSKSKKHVNPEARKAQSERMKKYWDDPKNRKAKSEQMKEYWAGKKRWAELRKKEINFTPGPWEWSIEFGFHYQNVAHLMRVARIKDLNYHAMEGVSTVVGGTFHFWGADRENPEKPYGFEELIHPNELRRAEAVAPDYWFDHLALPDACLIAAAPTLFYAVGNALKYLISEEKKNPEETRQRYMLLLIWAMIAADQNWEDCFDCNSDIESKLWGFFDTNITPLDALEDIKKFLLSDKPLKKLTEDDWEWLKEYLPKADCEEESTGETEATFQRLWPTVEQALENREKKNK